MNRPLEWWPEAERLYVEDLVGFKEIAKRLGVNCQKVRRSLIIMGVYGKDVEKRNKARDERVRGAHRLPEEVIEQRRLEAWCRQIQPRRWGIFTPYATREEYVSNRMRQYYWQDPQSKRDYASRYWRKNKNNKQYRDKKRAKHNEWKRKRAAEDPIFRIVETQRTRTSSIVKRLALGGKPRHTRDLLGCDNATLRKHLEFQFTKGMTWDNYGTYWHVDHAIPVAAHNLEDPEEWKKCFHYKNLQPLTAKENLKKRDAVRPHQTIMAMC